MIHLVLGEGFPIWASWAITYLLHSTLCLAAGALLCHPRLRLTARGRNLVWRVVLLAPLATTTFHTAQQSPFSFTTVHLHPPAPVLSVRAPAPASVLSVRAPAPALSAPVPVLPVPVPVPDPEEVPGWRAPTETIRGPQPGMALAAPAPSEGSPAREAGTPPTRSASLGSALSDRASPARSVAAPPDATALLQRVEPAPQPLAGPLGSGPSAQTGIPLALMLTAAFALVALGRLARLGGAVVRFRRDLRPRVAVHGLPRRLLDRLCARAGVSQGVRLTSSDRIDCPIALGTTEICLPVRSLDTLDERLLAAVLAHELAHLERRDNPWLTTGVLLEAVLFFQPALRVARRRLQQSAELACDDRAVTLTDDPVGLARSLAEVASWEPAPSVRLAHAIASPRRGLLERVERLLAPTSSPQPGSPRAGVAAAVVAFLAVALGAPAVVPTAQARPRFLAPSAAAALTTALAVPGHNPATASPRPPAERPSVAPSAPNRAPEAARAVERATAKVAQAAAREEARAREQAAAEAARAGQEEAAGEGTGSGRQRASG